MPAHVDARVRLALSGRQASGGWGRWVWAAAATCLLAVGAALGTGSGERAQAMPSAMLRAVDYATLTEIVQGSCASDVERPASESALVRMGNYRIADCGGDAAAPSARLARVEDLPVVGWAATRETEEVAGPNIGMTVLKNFVVFDVARGRSREYLAVARPLYDALERRYPNRASCAVCHNRSRDGAANPHDIRLRAWQ